MTEKIQITKLGSKDIALLSSLLEIMGKIDSEKAARLRAQAVVMDISHILAIAKNDQKLIGYAWAQSYGPHLRSGQVTARLHDLFVLPKYRRQGVAKQLFQFAVEWAEKSNITYLQWQGSKEAISFYASLGLKGDTKSDLEQHPFYEIEFKN